MTVMHPVHAIHYKCLPQSWGRVPPSVYYAHQRSARSSCSTFSVRSRGAHAPAVAEPQFHISTSMNKKTFMCGAHVCACVIKSVRVHVRVCVASILHIRCMFACVRMWVAQTRGPLARSSRWHQSAAAAVLVGAIHKQSRWTAIGMRVMSIFQ